MARNSQHEEYLRKAREADIQKQVTDNFAAREAWERIVISYLELAKIAERHDERHALS